MPKTCDPSQRGNRISISVARIFDWGRGPNYEKKFSHSELGLLIGGVGVGEV